MGKEYKLLMGIVELGFNYKGKIKCKSTTKEYKGRWSNIIECKCLNKNTGMARYKSRKITEVEAKIAIASIMIDDRLNKIRKLQEEATKLSIFIRDCI